MSIVAGKLFVGGASSVGITTGLVLLVVPYLKPEEASTSTSMVLVSEEDEKIESLKPEEAKEQKDDGEGEDDNQSDDSDDGDDEESENASSDDQGNEDNVNTDEDSNEDDAIESKDEKTGENEKNSADSNPSNPIGGGASGKKTRTVKLRFIPKTDTKKTVARISQLFSNFLNRRIS